MRSKSSVEDIRARFDADVERFSNLETGQSATVDAVVSLDLIAQAAAAVNPEAESLLDLGCGAGNFTLRLLDTGVPIRDVTLIDLSQPMLDRAVERIQATSSAQVSTFQTDLREWSFPQQQYDVVLAAAVLHHLRSEEEWKTTLKRIFESLKPGGSFWIFDLVNYQSTAVHQLMWARYGDYLTQLKDAEYRDHVFEYIEIEDSPRPLSEQLFWLRDVGFESIDVLHSNTCFAAFGGVRPL
ncbi:ubiquinone/menaquinone biosynthesis methyltransferase [Thalassoglobus neptunius]|uniref:Ubiquinone/menaquinone biosynthesis methyltransferase n=1 Tax=Thalassoglobus neptunius TaxID=1938619 RepID=A0A5C5X5H0_9PLAN|nr:class I SAM-dependent methyltransferase [Thalassoglobus neptunius]TWT57571.1 ubiquinone/menaquinone biosynthesis methyltransferase [Thalassoglobus neptunius]